MIKYLLKRSAQRFFKERGHSEIIRWKARRCGAFYVLTMYYDLGEDGINLEVMDRQIRTAYAWDKTLPKWVRVAVDFMPTMRAMTPETEGE